MRPSRHPLRTPRPSGHAASRRRRAAHDRALLVEQGAEDAGLDGGHAGPAPLPAHDAVGVEAGAGVGGRRGLGQGPLLEGEQAGLDLDGVGGVADPVLEVVPHEGRGGVGGHDQEAGSAGGGQLVPSVGLVGASGGG